MIITLLKNSSFKDSNNIFQNIFLIKKDWWRAVWCHKQFNDAINLHARCDILLKKTQKLFYVVWSELQDNQT